MNIPKFLSFEFHTRYFPGMLLSRLRRSGRQKTGFSSTMEHYIALAVCIILLMLGIPVAVSSGSIIGWIACGVGAAGTVALVINSILSRKGEPPSYDDFLAGVFFFFVFLGISCGVFVGMLQHSLIQGLLAGFAGLIAGYPTGILAGLWLQYLGWLSVAVNGLAGLAVLGMLAVDLVLLTGALFG
jgi:hypothetical protein